MPGIFGFFSTERNNADPPFHLCDVLRQSTYRKHYVSDSFVASNFSVGLLEVNEKSLHKIYETNDFVVAFYGELFSVDGNDLVNGLSVMLNPEKIFASLCVLGKNISTYKLNGDFLCVIYEKNKHVATIINDCIGMRHLYVYHDRSCFLFSSEIKSFLLYKDFDSTIDMQSVSDYLRYGYVLGDRTLFKKVSLLAPATCLKVESSGFCSKQYWTPKYRNSYSLKNLAEAIDEGYQLFSQSIDRRIRGASSFLVFLTGGLDSRLIASVMQKKGRAVTTATMGNWWSEEYRLAKDVCAGLGISAPIRVPFQNDWSTKYLRNLAWQSEGQYGAFGLVWQHGIAESLGGEFDCLLNGIFGGHLTFGSAYYQQADFDTPRNYPEQIARIDRGLNGQIYNSVSRYIKPDLNEVIQRFGLASIEEELARAEVQSDVFAYKMDAVFLYNRIRRGMIGVDQNYFYFKDSYPFSDHDLYEFYLNLSPELTLDHLLYKEIYKKYHNDMAEITWWSTGKNLYGQGNAVKVLLKKYAHFFEWYTGRISAGRLKLPHPWKVMYEDVMCRGNRQFVSLIREILYSGQCTTRGYINYSTIAQLLKRCSQGSGGTDVLGRLVMLELFFQYFVDKKVSFFNL